MTEDATPKRGYRWAHLVAGHSYVVVRDFVDFDGHVHPAGERWTFTGYTYLPYNDGLSLFVTLDGQPERQIRLVDDRLPTSVATRLGDFIEEAT